MNYIEGNIWDCDADAIVVTTNGIVKGNGALVMGKGLAKQAVDMIPGIDYYLGQLVQTSGNHVYEMVSSIATVFSFPTKHNWRSPADPILIDRSARELLAIVDSPDHKHLKKIVLPQVGCGLGQLSWPLVVEPILQQVGLDDRFYVISPPAKASQTKGA